MAGTIGISLIDVAAALVRRRKYLLILPLIASAVSVPIMNSFDKPVYVSRSYLRLNEQQARAAEALIRSPAVLKPVLEAVPLTGESKGNPLRAILAQNERIKFGPSKNQSRRLATLFTLSVEDFDPQRALRVNRVILDVWLTKAQPAPADAMRYVEMVDRAEVQFATITSELERISKLASAEGATDPGRQQITLQWSSLLRDLHHFTSQLNALNKELDHINRETIVAAPIMPVEAESRNYMLLALTAWAVTTIGVFAAILLRLFYSHHAPALRARLIDRSKSPSAD